MRSVEDEQGERSKSISRGKLSQAEKLKYEIADEMGVLDKVIKDGWKSLSAKETGRIGGLMTKRRNIKVKYSLKEQGEMAPEKSFGLY